MNSENAAKSEEHSLVDQDLFRDVIGHFTSGVTVITTRCEETNFGLTASAVTSLSLEPPMVLVCVNKKAGTCHAIAQSKAFGVNILNEGQSEIALKFARPSPDKFKGIDIDYGQLGEPLLRHNLAYLECRVVEEVTGGTHSVFLAEVQNAWAKEGTPLAYFRGKFGRFHEANDESVYRRIRHLVLKRDFPAAQALKISDLAYQLDTPQQTIYYAMTRLLEEGLVSRVGEAIYTVNLLDADTLSDALETRCALEITAAEIAVRNLSETELGELRKRMLATLPSSDGQSTSAEQVIEANTSFHDFAVALAKNATLLNTYRHLTAEAVISGALRATLEVQDTMARSELDILAADHVSLIKAYEDEDLEEVKRVIRRHTSTAKRLGKYLIDNAGGRI